MYDDDEEEIESLEKRERDVNDISRKELADKIKRMKEEIKRV